MNRLYVFAIGGSGERVMRSLLMTLIAGVDMPITELCPIFIDNDKDSRALTECKNLITFYNQNENGKQWGLHTMYEKNLGDKNYPSFGHVRVGKPVCLDMSGANIGTLNDVIGSIDDSEVGKCIKEERDLLFSNNDLDMPLDVGFVGNPNIGSLVLYSQSIKSDAFNGILQHVSGADGVIVVGSLFGGTGAAGFPLIVNEFNQKVSGANKPLIGGVAILPYFKTDGKKETDPRIDTDKYDVHSETFEAKTRAALMYYADNMKTMDYLYYVGSDHKTVMKHSVGGDTQNNEACLIELLSAMSIVDFAKQCKGNAAEIVYKRPIWGFVEDGEIKVSNLSGVLDQDLKKSLVKFQLLKLIFERGEYLKHAIENSMPFVSDLGITEDMRTEIINCGNKYEIAWALQNVFKEWDKWVKSLSNETNTRTFNFVQHVSSSEITKEAFFTDSDDGIAKTGEKGLFTKKKFIIDPEILNSIAEAYSGHPKKGASQEESVAKLLLSISEGLDKVIKEKCNL